LAFLRRMNAMDHEAQRWWSADWVFVLVMFLFVASAPLSLWHISIIDGLKIEYKGEITEGTVVRVVAGVLTTLQAWKRVEVKKHGGGSQEST
jgi:hypothetical protein